MFYGTAGVTVSICTIVEKKLTDFYHMLSEIVVLFCMQVILNLYQTNQHANPDFLSYGSHLKLCSDLKAPIYPKAESILFILCFPKLWYD
jgi:hypothetical protein